LWYTCSTRKGFLKRGSVCLQRGTLLSYEGHSGPGRGVMFVRVGLGECAIIVLLLLVVIAIVAVGVRQRGR
jgi:hypothetical protein